MVDGDPGNSMTRPRARIGPKARGALGSWWAAIPRDKRVDDDHVLALAEVLDRVPP